MRCSASTARLGDRPVAPSRRHPSGSSSARGAELTSSSTTTSAGATSDSLLRRLGDTLGLEAGRFDWRWLLAVAAAAVGIAALAHRLASVALNLPLRYTGDALLHAAYVKRMQEAGWYLDNDRLGAPWGLDAADFPLGGENIHWLALKLIGQVAPDPWTTINLYYLLTYPLIAVSAFLVLRAVRVRPSLAAGAGLLFAFLPFHQYRGVSHLLRSGYYIVPLLVLVVIWVAQPGRFLSPVTGRGRVLGFRRDRVVLIGVLALLVGANDTQNTAYGVLLVVLLSIAGSFASGSIRPTVLAVAFTGIAGLSLLANNAPYVYNVLTQGTNDQVAARSMGEQEVYALRPAHLVFPIPNHRIEALRSFMADVYEGTVPGEQPSQPLGVVGSLALVATLLAAATVLVGRRDQLPSPQLQTTAVCGLMSLVAIAVAAPGGFAFVLSALGLTIYRTWNRISLFIAFGSLLGGVLLLELWLARLAGSRWRPAVGRRPVAVLAVLLTVIGVLDQTPDPDRLTQSGATVRAFEQDRDFYEAVEAQHPEEGLVFQLPVTQFPEGGHVFELADYEQLTAYLHTDDLRWSTAAMRGRPASYWQEHVTSLSARDTVRAVAAAGFSGAVVYEQGYVDGGARMQGALEDLAGAPTVKGERDVVHHDLGPVTASLHEGASPEAVALAGEQLVDPVRAEPPAGLYGIERSDGPAFRWSPESEATFTVVNPSDEARTVTLTGLFSHLDPGASWVRVVGPGIDRTLVPSTDPLTWRATIEPGSHELQITSDGVAQRPESGDTRTLGLLIGVPIVLDDEARALLCGAADPEERPYCPPPPADETEPEPAVEEEPAGTG